MSRTVLSYVIAITVVFLGSTSNANQKKGSENTINEASCLTPFSAQSSRLKFLNGVAELGLKKNSSFVFSPLSMDGLFALIGPGYADRLKPILTEYFGEPLETAIEKIANVPLVSEGVRITSAMQIFTDANFEQSIEPDYIDFVTQTYGFQPTTVNFSNVKKTVETVNSWAAEKTKDEAGVPLIKEVITPAFITDDMVMILANALYFKGLWAEEFNAEVTQDQAAFTTSEGKSVKTPTMYKYGTKLNTNYQPTDGQEEWESKQGIISVELPFKGEEQSMIISMAVNKTRASAVTRHNHSDHVSAKHVLSEMISSGKVTDTSGPGWRKDTVDQFSLPKFEVESKLEELAGVFKAAGLDQLFESGALSNLSSDERLKLAKVLQKAIFKVDEKGAEGAAVSIGGAVLESLAQETNINIDGAFAFAVVNHQNGQVIFQGVIGDPTKD